MVSALYWEVCAVTTTRTSVPTSPSVLMRIVLLGAAVPRLPLGNTSDLHDASLSSPRLVCLPCPLDPTDLLHHEELFVPPLQFVKPL